MSKPSYIEILYDGLQAAVERGLIHDWTAEGPNVLLRKGSVELAVPVLEAFEYVKDLLRQDRRNKTAPALRTA